MTGWGSDKKAYEMETEEFGIDKLKSLIKEHDREIRKLSKMYNKGIISYSNLVENSAMHNKSINSLKIEIKNLNDEKC